MFPSKPIGAARIVSSMATCFVLFAMLLAATVAAAQVAPHPAQELAGKAVEPVDVAVRPVGEIRTADESSRTNPQATSTKWAPVNSARPSVTTSTQRSSFSAISRSGEPTAPPHRPAFDTPWRNAGLAKAPTGNAVVQHKLATPVVEASNSTASATTRIARGSRRRPVQSRKHRATKTTYVKAPDGTWMPDPDLGVTHSQAELERSRARLKAKKATAKQN